MEPNTPITKIKMKPVREVSPASPPAYNRKHLQPVKRYLRREASPFRPTVSRRAAPKKVRSSPVRSLMLQCMACVLIFLMVLGIQRMNIPAGRSLMDGLKFVVSNDAQIVQDGGVQMGQWVEQAVAVFAGGASITTRTPADGTPLREENGYVYADAGPVRAVMDGAVFYKGTNDDGTPYVRLRHGGGYESRYEGIATTLTVGQEVWAGDVIGAISKDEKLTFHFTLNGAAVELPGQ